MIVIELEGTVTQEVRAVIVELNEMFKGKHFSLKDTSNWILLYQNLFPSELNQNVSLILLLVYSFCRIQWKDGEKNGKCDEMLTG